MKYQHSRWIRMALLLTIAAAGLGIAPTPRSITEAQGGGTIGYGAVVFGAISATDPPAIYSFSGTEGDLVHVDVVGLTGGLDPSVTLTGPAQEVLLMNERNPLAVASMDAHLAIFLPQTGVYSLAIGSVGGTFGDFMLRLQGRGPVVSTPLVYGVPVDVDIPQNATPQYFEFEAENCATTLTVTNPGEGEPFTFPFIVKVRNEQGQEVGLLRGGDTLEDRVTVARLSGRYEVEVWADDPGLAGRVTLLVTCSGDAPQCAPGAGGAAGGPETGACPACVPCGDLEEGDLCADFEVTVTYNDDGTITFSWPDYEGALHYGIYLRDPSGAMMPDSVQLLPNTQHSLTAPLALHLEPGTYTVGVAPWAGEDGAICLDEAPFEIEGEGPVDWGPGAGDGEALPEECTVEMVAPVEGGAIANGLQTFFWTGVAGAESYRLRVYGQFDAVVADGAITAPSTSMTLDVSEAAIGAGYGGEDDFYIQIDAYREGERWCASGVRVTRNP